MATADMTVSIIEINNRLAKLEAKLESQDEKLQSIADNTEWLEDFTESDEGKDFANDMLNAFNLLTTHMPAIKKGLNAVGGALAAEDEKPAVEPAPAQGERIEPAPTREPVAVEK